MSADQLLGFWGTIFLLAIVPGPDWAFVLACSVRDRIVFRAVGGLMLGYVFLTAVVATGVAALVAGTLIALTVLTVAGAAYLIYLGTSILVQPATLQPQSTQVQDTSTSAWWSWVVRGIGVSGLNPKGWLVFLAVLPQFTDTAGRWPAWVQIAVLGLTFILTCSAVYLCVGLGARTVLRSRPGISRLISRISGIAMILVGTVLLLERLLT
jgi:threonine/homoserine/homoserine lactone efflux protein